MFHQNYKIIETFLMDIIFINYTPSILNQSEKTLPNCVCNQPTARSGPVYPANLRDMLALMCDCRPKQNYKYVLC